jgi:outer membrane protein assembly factor BamA
MYKMNQADTISPKSLSGVVGIYSTSGTWVGMIFSKMYFNEDRYRVTLAGGLMSINFQYYLEDPYYSGYINYNTGVDGIFAEIQRRVIKNVYLGVNFRYAQMVTNYDIDGAEEEIAHLYGLGGVIAYDGRDDVYYPRKGIMANINYISFPEFMGNELVSNKIEFDYNQYFGMTNKRDVLAIRLFAGMGIGDLDFNQQYGVGDTDIRGYTQGDYRGEQKLAGQAEYRWNPYDKIGFVGFVGLATVFNGVNEDDDGKLLPGAGAGFRYNVFPENHMNVGLDLAAGAGDWGIYFRIGESF